jgi:hypothetical protein
MSSQSETHSSWSPMQVAGAIFVWFWVAVPFVWGLYELIVKIPALFG